MGNRNPIELDQQIRSRITDKTKRYYIQSALTDADPEKKEQETEALRRIPDSFKKLVVVRDNINPWRDENGILFIGVEQFCWMRAQLLYNFIIKVR